MPPVKPRRTLASSARHKSEALASAHEVALDLFKAGLLCRQGMQRFDQMCLVLAKAAKLRQKQDD
jgi:hypothetical protein